MFIPSSVIPEFTWAISWGRISWCRAVMVAASLQHHCCAKLLAAVGIVSIFVVILHITFFKQIDVLNMRHPYHCFFFKFRLGDDSQFMIESS